MHGIISLACKLVLSVLVIFIVFNSTSTIDIMVQYVISLLFI